MACLTPVRTSRLFSSARSLCALSRSSLRSAIAYRQCSAVMSTKGSADSEKLPAKNSDNTPSVEAEQRSLVQSLRSAVSAASWQYVGKFEELKKKRCTKLFSKEQCEDDIAFFHVPPDAFYAMDASCPHEGGPLDKGEIEDFNGSPCVFCPWHDFEFSLTTGVSSVGLQQNVYPVKVVGDDVFIQTDLPFSLLPVDSTKTEGEVTSTCSPSVDGTSLCGLAVQALNTADPIEKVRLTRELFTRWQRGEVAGVGRCEPPAQPPRQKDIRTVAPTKIKLKKSGDRESVIAMLHSLCNIELWAIDLSLDIMARFSDVRFGEEQLALPREFFTDFAKVADDEAKHFELLNDRLRAHGSHFGARPVHNALWESATSTKDSLLARLAIVHMVHEGRGLDVQPNTRAFFGEHDPLSADVLEVVFRDEITHVAAGMKWFVWICQHSSPPLVSVPTFQVLVKKHFRSYLKPPFNTIARGQAGMSEEWYLPLVKPGLLDGVKAKAASRQMQ